MTRRISLAAAGLFVLGFAAYHTLLSNPSMNGTTPGCGGGGCHTYQTGRVTVTPLANRQVQITVSGTTSRVAGDLVNSSGVVVAFNNSTTSNPFILTAPSDGQYLVYAGYNSPNRRWDSASVVVTVTSVGDEGGSPEDFRLEQNYPNPFNPATTIKYRIAQKAHVTLRVFDLKGKEVALLIDEERAAGSYEMIFDATGLSSGVYLYRMIGDGMSFTRKMLVLK